MTFLSLLRAVIRPIVNLVRFANDRLMHKLIFKNSLTAGGIAFYGVNEGEEVDGYVILQDTYFKKPSINGYRFSNRYVMRENAHVRCAIIWRECMSMDGVRPIGILEGDRLITPYSIPQPIPRRFQQLFKEALNETDPSDEIMA